MKLKQANILIVDDDSAIVSTLQLLLKQEVSKVVTESHPGNILSLLHSQHFDLIMLDMNFSAGISNGNEGLYWMKRVLEKKPQACVILITAYADIELAIRALKEGASDFIIKPWKNETILEALQQALYKKNEKKLDGAHTFSTEMPLIGESESINTIRIKIAKVAPTDANVLILGENGTGKEIVARALHHQSLRTENGFTKVDMGALTESLFESELFGYKKGAFTDAKEDRAGRFESAQGGTLFLDEIGNISLQQQTKLLSVLQNRCVVRLGSSEVIPVDVRLIAATNLTAQQLSDERLFRKDLMYRINTISLTIPPLRERTEDIPLLASHFLKLYGEKYNKPGLLMNQSALAKLSRYNFPGNVRELQYMIERAVILTETEKMGAENFEFSELEMKQQKYNSNHEQEEVNLMVVEKQTILRAIEKNKGNITKAARELGITRTALYRRLGKHDI